jgi:hypothetical protein
MLTESVVLWHHLHQSPASQSLALPPGDLCTEIILKRRIKGNRVGDRKLKKGWAIGDDKE